ncbi:DUF262 domain-containing protein [Promicromonospora sp. MS192]|uniref:DUF262 domain-containing protein n=1 Tax=Promicromonospora sp. MS192 TaxID=3412684 RepID=UPI003C2FFC57
MANTSDTDEAARAAEELELVPLVPDQGEDESDGDSGYSAGKFSAAVAAKDWTVETLVTQMRKGRIDLTPSFQRRNAWLSNRKSKLIESIMLEFPIPQIVLAEKRNRPGFYFVLDGKQRLLTLRQFFADKDDPRDEGFDPLILTGLEVVSDLNRNDASMLDEGALARIENHTIRTVVLSKWNSEQLLLSLFLRLNTGSVPLSPQELRQALIPGEFMAWLDEESGNQPDMQILLGNKHPDRRMADAELALRFIAFSLSPIPYRGNLKQFLDVTSKELNDDWGYQQSRAFNALQEMGQAIRAGFELFGPEHFCRKWSGAKYERALNRAVFDFQVYSLSRPEVRQALAGKGEQLESEFKHACVSNVEFTRSITATTKTRDAFVIRHRVWRDIVQRVAGVSYPLPNPLDLE